MRTWGDIKANYKYPWWTQGTWLDIKLVLNDHRDWPTIIPDDSIVVLSKYGDYILAVFGCPSETVDGVRVGSPWCFTSSHLWYGNFTKDFMRVSKDVVRDMKTDNDVLFNFVHVDNEEDINWLNSMGFNVNMENPVAMLNGDAYAFSWISNDFTGSVDQAMNNYFDKRRE